MKGMFVPHDETTVKDLGGGSSRRLLAWNDSLMAAEVSFESGTEGALHTHPHTQCSYVLSGRFKYTVEGECKEMKPGDSVIVPGGAVHGALCVEAGTLLDVFTPAREDFIGA
ncbi:MAG: cupin domain-containing protein [Synergistaceae bacterium]|nr:cupin domain-containing protein [Synergistaceae bacterium]